MPASSYAHLVVTLGDPGPGSGMEMLAHPRRARVRTRTYGAGVVDVELWVVARARGRVCVRQERPGHAPWNAWIDSRDATPL